jgi:hypothetical protein
MKHFLQMTLAVFIGTLSSGLIIDYWHVYQERVATEAAEEIRAVREKQREADMEKIRDALQKQYGQQQNAIPNNPYPEGFQQEEFNGMPHPNK